MRTRITVPTLILVLWIVFIPTLQWVGVRDLAFASQGVPGNAVVIPGLVVTTENSQMTLQLSTENSQDSIRANLLVTNSSATEFDITGLQPHLEVYDRASKMWPIETVSIHYETALMVTGNSFRIEISASNPNVLEYSGPVFVRVRDVLDSDLTVFGIWFSGGVTSIPDSAPINPLNESQNPIGTAADSSAASIQYVSGSSVEAADSGPVGPLNIDAMIPPLEDFPSGLWIANQGKLGQATITATFGDPAMADRFLNDWGWQENAFIYLEGSPTNDGISYVDVGIHRFSNVNGAMLAMEYYASSRAELMGMWGIENPDLGDSSMAITNGAETSVYAVIDTVVIRVSIAGSNPSPWATSVAETIVRRGQNQVGLTSANRILSDRKQPAPPISG